MDSIDLGALRHDEHNPREHNVRNMRMLRDSLEQLGAGRSILIDEDDIILAGNGVIDAAKEAGITKVRVIDADGTEIIAVRRTNLTPEQKRLMGYFDNRTGELAAWNAEQVAADASDGLDMGQFFMDTELATILQDDSLNIHELGLYDNIIPAFQQKEDVAKKDGNWFYVEFYNQDERFAELIALLKQHMTSAHALDGEWFYQWVKEHATEI